MSFDPDRTFKKLRRATQQAVVFIQPVLPYAVHGVASAGAFTAGLAATQLAGVACRVSCATPVLGPAIGVLGVGFASAIAGQASVQCQRHFSAASAVVRRRAWQRQDMLLDALMGVVLYKALGGRFRSVLPSNLFYPGALARESLPAPGAAYATELQRNELLRMFRRDGCHHCGQRRGRCIADHMPTNKSVHGGVADLIAVRPSKPGDGLGRLRRGLSALSQRQSPTLSRRLGAQLKSALGLPVGPAPQRYYPQCLPCSQRQAAAARNNRPTLVTHFRRAGLLPHYVAGSLVGLRHYCAWPAASLGAPFQQGAQRHEGSNLSSSADVPIWPWSSQATSTRDLKAELRKLKAEEIDSRQALESGHVSQWLGAGQLFLIEMQKKDIERRLSQAQQR